MLKFRIIPKKLLIIAAVLLCFVGVYSFQQREASLIEAQLISELDALQPVARSQVVSQERHAKPKSVYVTRVYRSGANFEDVKRHYAAEFEGKGWVSNKQHEYADQFTAEAYCKGSFSAQLKRDANHSQNEFWLVLDWHLNDCPWASAAGKL